MKEKVIAVYDIGKTNKKIILFNHELKPVYENEKKIPEIKDEDGFECDDIEHIEKWIKDSVNSLAKSDHYELTAINFTTYGATLVYLDKYGKRLTPVYNYLKLIDEKIPEKIYKKYGGQDEFCRRTASPALGMLNSGMQMLWLKYSKPEIFRQVKYILHFPQYFSYMLTRNIYSEHTSIGCHTALWDFDEMKYHKWISEEGFSLPDPVDINTNTDIIIDGRKTKTGIGIHDSSASLVPYIKNSSGKFILMSTGTWCINMNPFNSEALTTEQLDHDCLCYLSINKQALKSSRLFLGHLHETALRMLNKHFKTAPAYYQTIKPDKSLIEICEKRARNKRFYFDTRPYSRELKKELDFFSFNSFKEGYHQLMVELTQLTIEALDLVIPSDDDIENIYITGGFSKNRLFLKLLSDAYPMKSVFKSEVVNATALGAANIIIESLNLSHKPQTDLGLTQC